MANPVQGGNSTNNIAQNNVNNNNNNNNNGPAAQTASLYKRTIDAITCCQSKTEQVAIRKAQRQRMTTEDSEQPLQFEGAPQQLQLEGAPQQPQLEGRRPLLLITDGFTLDSESGAMVAVSAESVKYVAKAPNGAHQLTFVEGVEKVRGNMALLRQIAAELRVTTEDGFTYEVEAVKRIGGKKPTQQVTVSADKADTIDIWTGHSDGSSSGRILEVKVSFKN